MPKTSKTRPTADEIAEMATRGEDVSAYFTNKFNAVRPVRRVNVDLTEGMLRELDERAARLNISRQAVIKTLLGRALNEERVTLAALREAPLAGIDGSSGFPCLVDHVHPLLRHSRQCVDCFRFCELAGR